MDDEFEMVDAAFDDIKRQECDHELIEKEVRGITQDGRVYTKMIIVCAKDCGYHKVKIIDEEKVSDDIIRSC